MRLKSFDGSVCNISWVKPAIEKRETFNGRTRRDFEICSNSKIKGNGLVICVDPVQNTGMSLDGNNNYIVIGNISAEFIDKVVNELLTNGYADVSQLDYQPEQIMPERFKFDAGVGQPYGYKTNMLWGVAFDHAYNGCLTNPIPGNSGIDPLETDDTEDIEDTEDGYETNSADDEEDLSKFTNEDLRRTIYDFGKFTMVELGAMCREELIQAYNDIDVPSED
jgi:hypothetical protein